MAKTNKIKTDGTQLFSIPNTEEGEAIYEEIKKTLNSKKYNCSPDPYQIPELPILIKLLDCHIEKPANQSCYLMNCRFVIPLKLPAEIILS